MSRILCYGDSLTAGFCRRGFEFEPYSNQLVADGHRVETLGLCGWTAEDMVIKALQASTSDFCGNTGPGFSLLVNREHFDWVFILAGTNDLGGDDLEAGEIFKYLSALITTCLLAKVDHIGVLTVPACGVEGSYPELAVKRAELNASIRQVSEQFGGSVFCVDSDRQLPNDKGSRELPEVAALWDADQLHLSPEGSRVLGQFVLQCMRKRQSVTTGTGTDVATAAATATGSNQPAAGTVTITTGTATATTRAVDELKPRIEPVAPRDSAKRSSCILM